MPSKTLAQLRQLIGTRTRQEFWRRFGTGANSATATGGGTTYLIDTAKLTQANDWWIDQWVYLKKTQTSRIISDSTSATQRIDWAEATTAVQANDGYEIWGDFEPTAVNAAINQAIRMAWPFFFQYAEDYIVIQQDHSTGVIYSLSNFSPAPKIVTRIYMEAMITSYVGTATSGGASTLTDTNQTNIDSDDVGSEIRIYGGTGAGQRRTISQVNTNTKTYTVSSAWTTQPDSTSRYAVVDITDENRTWAVSLEWKPDRPQDPQNIILGSHPHGSEGYLIRVEYEAEYTELTAETDSTACPVEYIVPAAISNLYADHLVDSPATEQSSWEAMAKLFSERAQQFAKLNRQRHRVGSVKTDQMGGRTLPPFYPFRT